MPGQEPERLRLRTISAATASGAPGAGRVLLACGIGNPDRTHQATRHNAGKWLLDRLAPDYGALRDFAAVVAGTRRGGWLAKTTCYMNESGRPVKQLLDYLQVEPAGLLVAHDELDLPPGQLRFKFGGGLAGHNGLRDIAARLGTRDFWRLRIGIGKPPPDLGGAGDGAAAAWVLSAPDRAAQQLIDAALERMAADWQLVRHGDMDAAMRAAHRG